jgi:hypothetical protein
VHLAVPFSERLRLKVAGAEVQPRVAFGGTTAFDVSGGGSARLEYSTPLSQYAFMFVQTLLWLLVMLAVFDVGRVKRRFLQARNREVTVVDDQGLPALSFTPGGNQ